MEEFWELVNLTEAIPKSAAALKCDKKAYTYMYPMPKLSGLDCQDQIWPRSIGHPPS
jgi:hypothetical protein